MSKFSELVGKPGPKPEGMKVEMDPQCQICFESVDGAEYFHIERILKWTCSQGHVSYIEEFRL